MTTDRNKFIAKKVVTIIKEMYMIGIQSSLLSLIGPWSTSLDESTAAYIISGHISSVDISKNVTSA